MTLSPGGLKKIVHMIGVLGSDSDGEVLAAARAIRRVLQSDGCTFGDLKAALGGGLVIEDEIATYAAELAENTEFMKGHEARFVRQMHGSFVAKPSFKMSERQASWLAYLYAKYGSGR